MIMHRIIIVSICLFAILTLTPVTAAASRHPILLFPGSYGSQIDAKLNKAHVVHPFCFKTWGWYQISLNPFLLLPGVVDCYIDNFKLDYNEKSGRSQNRPGVETRVPGFGDTETIEYLFEAPIVKLIFSYMHELVESLVQLGYERRSTLRGAPFDFRLSPDQNPELLPKFKALIEKMYSENGNKKVILIAHSTGARLTYYFLQQQNAAWKQKYIQSWIAVAPSFGGQTGTLAALSAGVYGRDTTLTKSQVRELHRTFPSFLFDSPDANAFNETVIFKFKDQEYTAKDLPRILKLIGHETGVKQFPAISKLIPNLTDPGVDILCLRGTNTPTIETIIYKDDKSYPDNAEIIRGAGDGIVNKVSADTCLRWSGRKGFRGLEFDGVKHIDMVKNANVLKYISEQVERINKE